MCVIGKIRKIILKGHTFILLIVYNVIKEI